MSTVNIIIYHLYRAIDLLFSADAQDLLLLFVAVILFALYVLARSLRISLQKLEGRLSKAEARVSRTDSEVKGLRKELREHPPAPVAAATGPIVADTAGEELTLRAQQAALRRRPPEPEPVPPAPPIPIEEPKEIAPRTVAAGLEKTRENFFSRLRNLFGSRTQIGAETYGALEELLITSDLGVRTSQRLLQNLREEVAATGEVDEGQLRDILKQAIAQILADERNPEIIPAKVDGKPLVVLFVGVNGVGKTTTIGKLAARFKKQGAKVLIAACDTFRAAAVEQLAAWARRAGVELVSGAIDAKPSTVAFQAVHKAQAENYDVLLIDTAGRLHTRVNLMNELASVVQILNREMPGCPQEIILILDASTGQNALQQARTFNERSQLTGLVVTKLDGTPRGGIVVAIKEELNVPIRYIGVGEAIEDLKLFSVDEFVGGLFGEDGGVSDSGNGSQSASGESVKKQRRRKREKAE